MIFGWVFQHKVICLLSVALCAFFISTIVLAVQKNNAEGELSTCSQSRLNLLEIINILNGTTTTETPTDSPDDSTTTMEPTDEPPIISKRYRLPDSIKPITYNLMLHPNLTIDTGNLDAFNFVGTNRILLQVQSNTDQIILHSNKLVIDTVTVTGTEGEIASTFEVIDDEELLIISLISVELSQGNEYELDISFSGDMKNRIVGLYISSYQDEDSPRKYIATSKFEPTYARQAFPCFDEPAMKANFNISLVIPRGDNYMALSNMNILSTEVYAEDNSLDIVHFNESVPMSTYLACFIVSDFVAAVTTINASVGDDFTMSVYATPGQISKVNFALETGAAITEYYINYFQIAYPLPKLDMVAIPDFVSGAMEHWGLVTFRETALLYDETISSTSNKQRVASVVAHELAHMWFGNLVTMAWWNDLWLNEGFASYIENKGVNEVYPEWGMMDQFIIGDLHTVLALDATLASHPIVQVAESPDQITELFDTITYSKGASIIRMLEHFIGPTEFQTAVTAYLNAHKFGNAVTADLLTQIDNLDLGVDVTEMMDTWTKQMGYPVVNVQQISATEYSLTQTRFLSNPASHDEEQEESEFNYKWTIPITYFTDLDSVQTLLFHKEDANQNITVNSDHAWLKLNIDQIGYYRINYPTEMWRSLTTNYMQFSATNRAHLLNDAFSLAEATLIDYTLALNLLSSLRSENDYVPWAVVSSQILDLKDLLYYSDIYTRFKDYVHTLVNETFHMVSETMDTDNHLRNHLRTTMYSIACSFELQACLDETTNQFNEWLNAGTLPIPDLRNVVYYYGVQSIGEDQNRWNQVWNLYKSELDASEKLKLMNALAAVPSRRILQRFIELAWVDSNVRQQDYFTCLQYIAANPHGEMLVWEYVRENWLKLVERFGLNERYLGRMIPSITSRFTTQFRLDEMNAFFDKYPEAGAGETARKQALETVQNNINWLAENKPKVEEWLNLNMIING